MSKNINGWKIFIFFSLHIQKAVQMTTLLELGGKLKLYPTTWRIKKIDLLLWKYKTFNKPAIRSSDSANTTVKMCPDRHWIDAAMKNWRKKDCISLCSISFVLKHLSCIVTCKIILPDSMCVNSTQRFFPSFPAQRDSFILSSFCNTSLTSMFGSFK